MNLRPQRFSHAHHHKSPAAGGTSASAPGGATSLWRRTGHFSCSASFFKLQVVLFAAALQGVMACAHIDPLGADTGRVAHDDEVVRAPYLRTLRQFGYLPGATPSATSKLAPEPTPHPPFLSVAAEQTSYLWLPVTVAELGIRVRSPAKAYAAPQPGDVLAAAYAEHKKEDVAFDANLVVWRCSEGGEQALFGGGLDLGDASGSGTGSGDGSGAPACRKWQKLAESDPHAAIAAGRDVPHRNAELRLHHDDAGTALLRGVYRISVVGPVGKQAARARGTYLLEVGLASFAEGPALAASLADLADKVRPQRVGEGAPATPSGSSATPAAPQPLPFYDSLVR